MDTIIDAPAATPLRQWMGHPRGLYVLAGTELWDRISFHGMEALLTLYMVGYLLMPGRVEHIAGFAAFRAAVQSVTGPLTVIGLASQVFGIYLALVSLMPLLGGWLGDKVLGRRNTVVLGGLLMVGGHFAMAFDVSFLLALLLLTTGAGCLRGNLVPQIDTLYPAADRRRADAFQIYYSMVNAGAFIAPLLTGALQVGFGWHVAFGFAGVGMLLGLVIYLAGGGELPSTTVRVAAITRGRLTPDERRRVITLFLIAPATTAFYIAQSQIWNVYNLWVRDHVQMRVGAFDVPIPWLQSLDGLSPLVFLPPMLVFWRWQAKRGKEPDDLGKVVIGSLIFTAGTLWLALAGVVFGGGRTPLLWAVFFHLLSNLGWLYFVPIMAALFVEGAPAGMRGFMFGVFSAAIFVANLVSGRLGGLYETLSAPAFWTLHAAFPAIAAALMLAFQGPLRRGLSRGPGADANLNPA
jgi:POT family proton-dependent oligopeptide transporter